MSQESSHTHPKDPPWTPFNFNERRKARQQRFALAAVRHQTEQAVTIDIQQCNILEEAKPARREYEIAGRSSYVPISKRVLHAVSQEFDIPVEQIVSKRQEPKFTIPRFVVVGLMLELTRMSLPAIGRVLGGRDHTTILHGRTRINGLLQSEAFRNRFDQIKAGLLA